MGKSQAKCPEYPPIELALDELYEARKRWADREWIVTARVMAEVGIDAALDEYLLQRGLQCDE